MRGFAAAGFADQADAFSGADRQIHIVDRVKPGAAPCPLDRVEFGQRPDFEQRRHDRGNRQRTTCAGDNSVQGSGASSQIGCRRSQRRAEAARRQRAAQIGQLAGNGIEVVETRFRNRRGGEQLARIGMGRVIEQVASVGAISTMCPACMTAIRSQYSPARPRSWVISSVDIRVVGSCRGSGP